jgi:uncharacterized protein YegL
MEKRKITRVAYVLDRSGSMQGVLPLAIRTLNENVKLLREETSKNDQDATLTFITFDDSIKEHYHNRSVQNFQPIDEGSIRAGNSTALFDAAGIAIERLQQMPVGDDEDVSYLLIVITDGENNVKIKFDQFKLASLMRSVQVTDRWTLTFLVPKGGKKNLVNNFGIPEGNISEWENTAEGVKRYAVVQAAGLRNYVQNRSNGVTNSKSFYTDLSHVTTRDIKQLDDLSSKVKVLSVTRNCEIREFIESRGFVFTKGCAYYQLIAGKKSADKVQDYKKVLIFDKKTKRVHGGDDVRSVLGLPLHETKLRPGDHANFDIFIQSTSVNRKLVAGTKVIFAKF